jgi:lipopolysaccharide export system permease protein
MPAIQKYLFRQLLGPTVVAAVALCGVTVLSGSLKLLNLVVSERQSALMFIRLVVYSIPPLFSFVAPISCLVATLFVLNKLHTEQEIVVCFASGMSRWQVTSPIMRVCAFFMIALLAVNLWLAPACNRATQEEFYRARNDLVGTLVREGEFTDSTKGLTVYAQQVAAGGQLKNLFVYQPQPDGASDTYDSRTGVITHRNGLPVLVMRDGSREAFSNNGALDYLKFDEYTLDLTPYTNTSDALSYKPSDLYMHELLYPDPAITIKKSMRRKMLAEAHGRLSSPLYVPTFVMFAILAVIGGAFSRLGYGRQIAVAAAAALVVRLMGILIQAACENAPWLNVVQYLIPLVPGFWAARRLFRGSLVGAKPGSGLGLGPRLGRGRQTESLKPLGARAI